MECFLRKNKLEINLKMFAMWCERSEGNPKDCPAPGQAVWPARARPPFALC